VGESERETGEKKREGERERNEVNDWIEFFFFSNCGIFLSNAIRAALSEPQSGLGAHVQTQTAWPLCAPIQIHMTCHSSPTTSMRTSSNRPTVLVAISCCRSKVKSQITLFINLYLKLCVCVNTVRALFFVVLNH
jgi:hypothetical protein